MDEFDISDARKHAGELLRAVLVEKITPLEAGFEFPKDIEDPSLKAAFHALIHFEADEDLRRADPLYAEEQNSYLETISTLLMAAEPLPVNIIAEYSAYYPDSPLYKSENKENFFKRMLRLINM